MDPYAYPGTNILKNLRDIQDSKNLADFEAEVTAGRLKELENNPIAGSFDATHLKAIHGYIFQDVYSWAGLFRTVNIARSGQFYFAFATRVDPSVDELLSRLRQENLLKGLNAHAFAGRVGHYLGELNAIHAFRDGNGRTQREFIRELAEHIGYTLNWSRVSPEQMRDASRISFQQGSNADMAEIIGVALATPVDIGKLPRGDPS